jgi:hypothetical protein
MWRRSEPRKIRRRLGRMKVSKRMQLDLVWIEEICWKDLPVQIQQQVKELIVKLLPQAAGREGVNNDDADE